MSENTTESLHKEFELERMILFSDAVFAIAITLLILEIKFPRFPDNFDYANTLSFLKPTLIQFFAFMISFFFIGIVWSSHLTLCRFLKRYNNTVIFFNLLLLFFIVTFPFSISAFVGNVNHTFLVAILVYIGNIFFVIFTQFLFTNYILKKNSSLSVPGQAEEKRYFYMKARNSFIMMLATVAVMITVIIISKGNKVATELSLYVLPAFAIISRRNLKKYKPKKTN